MRHELRIAILAFALLAILLPLAVRLADRTNVGTTNGLWKAPSVHDWETQGNGYIDTGAYLYFPVMGRLVRLSPDGWWKYGAESPIVTFREMAAWNAVFSALATAIVAALIFRLSGSPPAALLTAFFHASAAFIVVNTLNSEDIMPGYAMFAAGSYSLVRFAAGGGWAWIAASSSAYALSTLLHWTLTPAAVAGAAVFYLWDLAGDWRRRWWIPVTAGVAYLAAVYLALRIVLPHAFIRLIDVLYPSKASGSGWVGFLPEKIRLLFAAMPCYFTGGYNIPSVERAWECGPCRVSMLTGYAWFALAVAGLIHLIRRGGIHRRLAVWSLTVFGAAQAMNLYAQPQDPQMQIQPMFAGVVGFFGVLDWLSRLPSGRARRLGPAALALAAGGNLAWTANEIVRLQPTDTESIHASAEFQKQMPAATHFLVIQGMEGWLTWEVVLQHQGKMDGFYQRGMLLATPFTLVPKATGAATADYLREGIEEARQRGLRVFAGVLWNGDLERLERSLSTVAAPEEVAELYSRMMAAYREVGETNTVHGRFVEIVPVAP